MTLVLKVLIVLVMACWYAAACIRFRQISQSRTFSCDRGQLHRNLSGFSVFGTEVYHEESLVCMSALHSGAININGGDIIFKKKLEVPGRVYGSTRNRIVSRSKDTESSEAVYIIEKTSPTITKHDVRADVVVVHNSFSGSSGRSRVLFLSCLAQDPTSNLTNENIVLWNYTTSPFLSTVTTVRSSDQVVVNTTDINVLRCLGRSPATDVLAAVQFPDSAYHSPTPTVRLSWGENLTIPLVKKTQLLPNYVRTRRLPDDWSVAADSEIPLSYGPANLSLAGIYLAGNDPSAHFDVMVRDCEKEKYGIHCSEDCPKCQHGGQCHPQTGTCVCPPGFTGDTCQRACQPGTFGEQCQLRCDAATLGFPVTEEGDCRGLVVCLPAPFGCSCAPGYTYYRQHNGASSPICTKECLPGTYGADCSETCKDCLGNVCDRFSGACFRGERREKPRDLPTSAIWWLLLVPLIILTGVILFIFYWRHKRQMKMSTPDNCNQGSSNETTTGKTDSVPLPHTQINDEVVRSENIYENVYPETADGNISAKVSYAQDAAEHICVSINPENACGRFSAKVEYLEDDDEHIYETVDQDNTYENISAKVLYAQDAAEHICETIDPENSCGSLPAKVQCVEDDDEHIYETVDQDNTYENIIKNVPSADVDDYLEPCTVTLPGTTQP
nr:uncharacterized protein LOC123746991 isoform X2 [Procambarus clarkii]